MTHTSHTPLMNFSEYRNAYFSEHLPFPQKIDFGLTTQCQLKCIMCHHSLPGRSPVGDLTPLAWKRLKIAIAKATEVTIAGSGDPCLHAHFAEMVDELGPLKPKVLLHTSMNFWGKNHARAIVQNVDQLYCSMDATTKSTYEKIRVGGNFDKAIGNIRKVVEERRKLGGPLNIAYGMVAMKSNLEELLEAPALAADLGIDGVFFQPMYEITELRESALLPDVLPRLREVIAECRKRCDEHGVEFMTCISHLETNELSTEAPAWSSAESNCDHPGAGMEMFAWEKVESEPQILECTDPYNQIMVYANGMVHSCGDRYCPMGNLNEKDFEEIWNGEAFNRFRERMHCAGNSPCRGCARQQWIPEPTLENLPTSLSAADLTNLTDPLGFWLLEGKQGNNQFRWTKPEATLFLKNLGGRQRLELSLRWPEWHDGKSLLISVNGVKSSVTLRKGHQFIGLPVLEVGRMPFLKITMTVPEGHTPRSLDPLSHDTRDLGFSFFSAKIVESVPRRLDKVRLTGRHLRTLNQGT